MSPHRGPSEAATGPPCRARSIAHLTVDVEHAGLSVRSPVQEALTRYHACGRYVIWAVRKVVQMATNFEMKVADTAQNRRSYSGRCATPPTTARPLEVSRLHPQPVRHNQRQLSLRRLTRCRAWSGIWLAKLHGRHSKHGRLNRHFQPTPPSNRFGCQIVDGT
jgi:hypothetical protein